MRRALALVAILAAFPAAAQPSPADHDMHHGPRISTFTMSGEGTASAVPDMAIFTTGVLTEAKTAREALDANTAAMAKLMESLTAAGIAERDVATSGFTVQPRYVYQQRNDGTQDPPRITGYEVRNGVSVKVRDLTKLGGVLDRAVTEGSNVIDGLVFDISEKKALLDDARKKAFADARSKAELYATAAGVKLGPIRDLSEQTGSYPPPRPYMMRAEAKASADVPVARGEQEIQVNITATWDILP